MTIHSSDPFATPDQDRSAIRRFRGRLPSAVCLWTTRDADGRPAGLTLSSTLVIDGEPGRVLGVLDEESTLWEALRRSGTGASTGTGTQASADTQASTGTGDGAPARTGAGSGLGDFGSARTGAGSRTGDFGSARTGAGSGTGDGAPVRTGAGFVVAPLRESDRQLADIFAGLMPSPGGPFVGRTWHETPWGPVLDGVSGWAGCRVDGFRPMGWGLLVEATIEHVAISEAVVVPLLHYKGRYLGGPAAG